MHDYAAERVLSEEGGRVDMYLPDNMDALVRISSWLTGSSLETQRKYWDPGFARPGHTGLTAGSWIITNTFSSKYATTPPERRIKVAAHEMFHVYQAELSGLRFRGGNEVPPTGPRWLRDGSAEFFAYKALDAGGVVSYDAERRTRFIRSAQREDRPLSDMENQSGIRGVSYRFFLLAVELLAHHAGEDAIIRFHALQQPGTTWQQAFQIAFGMTIEEFYELFEAHRAAGFPTVEIPEASTSTRGVFLPGAPSYVRWEFGDDVSVEDRRNAAKAVRSMHDYAVSLGMPETYEEITGYLYYDHDEMMAACARAVQGWTVEDCTTRWGGLGLGGDGWFLVHLGHPTFQKDLENGRYPYKLTKVVGGEFNNARRYELTKVRRSAGSDEVPEAGPRWLGSGSNGFISSLARSEAGLMPYDEHRQELVRVVRNMDTPLHTMETRKGFMAPVYTPGSGVPYQYAALAAELLAHHASVSALMQYDINLKKGTPWQETFRETFAMTVEEFYELFEEHRAAGFPVVEIEHP